MNADCESELARLPAPYPRLPTISKRNRALAPLLLWLTRSKDALLVERPWEDGLRAAAERRDVELLAPGDGGARPLEFTPWGWTPSAMTDGVAMGALVNAPPLDVVVRVNSKRFSHAVERALGIATPGARLVESRAELDEALATTCPGPNDKWVVKDLFGFAARERVLGRGPRLDPASETWVERKLVRGLALLVEPWLDVVREYGIPIQVAADGSVDVLGIVDVATNGAGVSTGYYFGRPIDSGVRAELERVAIDVGRRLYAEGYSGPAGIDALECVTGLRPLLEVNARYTLGFVALAVEAHFGAGAPAIWNPRSDYFEAG